MLLDRTGHRLQRPGTLSTTTSEHRTSRLGVLAPKRRGGRLPRQPLGACARLDLLGFELCSPEVLLDLQDLDHELSPTTRELVQVSASPLMRMTKLRATRARPRPQYMRSTITTFHIAHHHHDVMKRSIGSSTSTKTSFGLEYRFGFCIL